MDLNRLKNDAKLDLCRRYYLGGFALLPFLWAVNAIWFYQEAFAKPHYDEQPQIRKYVIRSAVGAFLWAGIFIAWVCVFQMYRPTWGELGDILSFSLPRGIA